MLSLAHPLTHQLSQLPTSQSESALLQCSQSDRAEFSIQVANDELQNDSIGLLSEMHLNGS